MHLVSFSSCSQIKFASHYTGQHALVGAHKTAGKCPECFFGTTLSLIEELQVQALKGTTICSHTLRLCRRDVRSARKRLMQEIGRLERDGELSSDEQHRLANHVQTVTDKYIAEIEDLLKSVQDP